MWRINFEGGLSLVIQHMMMWWCDLCVQDWRYENSVTSHTQLVRWDAAAIRIDNFMSLNTQAECISKFKNYEDEDKLKGSSHTSSFNTFSSPQGSMPTYLIAV